MNDTVIQLINAYEIDSDYNHTPWFTTQIAQTNWFRTRTIMTQDNTMYQRKDGNYFAKGSLYDLRNVNYLIAINPLNNEKYFYFVIDKLYKNPEVTELVLQLDVIQTYMFSFSLDECLVEREHVNRWNSLGNAIPQYIDENINTGEYVVKKKQTIYDYSNKGTYFITSSDRLGVSDDGRPGNPSGTSRGRRG